MIKCITPLILLLLLLCPVMAYADMALVPQTGQTTSYATGDDGDTQMGVPWPSPRFTDNGNGTITDNLTGLVWLKNANCLSSITWASAISSTNALASGACGLTDGSTAGQWRLPNRKELKSLINRQQANTVSWLNGLGFSNVQSSGYWSSSTYAGSTGIAWGVDMLYNGVVGFGDKSGVTYVWPVRSGQDTSTIQLPATGQTATYATADDGSLKKGVAWPVPRFTDNADGTVIDKLTGLMWLKDANCFGTQTWANAISAANSLASGGACGLTDGSAAGDWRLPNVEQLESLVDLSQYNLALPSGHPFSNVQFLGYWSSSTNAGSTGIAWGVDMRYGLVGFGDKSGVTYVWLVRSGLFWVLDSLIISAKPGTVFGAYTLGTAPLTREVTLRNIGDTVLNVTSIAFDDTADFSVATGGSQACATLSPTIPADTSCTVLATFTPASKDKKTGNLKVTANAKYINVPFTGTGVGKLTVTLSGVGGVGAGGKVTSDPAGISCTAGSCFNYFDPYSTVNLHATASGNSVFDKWTGACTGTSEDTSVTMDGLKSVTANFKYVLALRIPGSPPADYPSIQEAYAALAAVSSAGTILARSTALQENPTFDTDLSFLLKGGYNTNFSSNSGGFTTVSGTMTIEKGSLTLDQFVIE